MKRSPFSKSVADSSPRSGSISTSRAGTSSARCAITFCSVRMLIDCSATPRNDESCSRVISGVPMLTAITTSAPIAFTMSTGRFLTSPPSPSILPSMSRGAKIPGTDMLPRIAMYSGPRSKTTALPSTRLVATARNGMGSRSKLPMSSLRQVSPCSSSSRFCPVSAPVESLDREIPEAELERDRIHGILDLAPDRELVPRRLVREE